MEERRIPFDEIRIFARTIARRVEDKENITHVIGVDDICDTGDTMKHVTKQLALGNIPYTTACICTKEKFTHWLDHYGSVVSDNKWIVFPWE